MTRICMYTHIHMKGFLPFFLLIFFVEQMCGFVGYCRSKKRVFRAGKVVSVYPIYESVAKAKKEKNRTRAKNKCSLWHLKFMKTLYTMNSGL